MGCAVNLCAGRTQYTRQQSFLIAEETAVKNGGEIITHEAIIGMIRKSELLDKVFLCALKKGMREMQQNRRGSGDVEI